MLGKKLALIVVVVALALMPLSAGAQLNPRTKPTTVGPVTFDGDTYKGRKCRDGRFLRNQTSGRAISNWTYCVFFYRYSAAQDNSSTRDFGAIWLSSRVNPTSGWCVERAISHLGVRTSGRGNVIKRAPQGTGRTVNRSREVLTRLVVNAGGSGSTKGVIKKSWTLHKGTLAIRRFKKNGFANLQLRYRGQTRRTAAFAQAFEMSWPQTGRPPSVFPELRVLHKRCS
jgi:hypothetical protein